MNVNIYLYMSKCISMCIYMNEWSRERQKRERPSCPCVLHLVQGFGFDWSNQSTEKRS